MTNDLTLIDKALRTAVIAALGATPYAAEGVTFNPSQGGVYCELTNVPGQAFAVTLGSGGEDEHVGFYQVDVVSPMTEGTAGADAIVNQFYQLFPAGRGLVATKTVDGEVFTQAVTISGFQRGGRRKDGTRNRVAVSIYWRAHTTRTPV